MKSTCPTTRHAGHRAVPRCAVLRCAALRCAPLSVCSADVPPRPGLLRPRRALFPCASELCVAIHTSIPALCSSLAPSPPSWAPSPSWRSSRWAAARIVAGIVVPSAEPACPALGLPPHWHRASAPFGSHRFLTLPSLLTTQRAAGGAQQPDWPPATRVWRHGGPQVRRRHQGWRWLATWP